MRRKLTLQPERKERFPIIPNPEATRERTDKFGYIKTDTRIFMAK